MALSKVSNLNLNELTTMQIALDSNKQLDANIDAVARNYHTIDVRMAMTNLGNVGQVLKLAYAGSKGFPCSTSTLKILSRYQSMIKNSYIASSSFVGACLKALQYHKLALMAAEKEKLDTSIKMLQKCSDLAKAMADESEKLVKEATDLCNLSEEALLTAQSDENVSKKEKERITQLITDSRARQKEMEVNTKHLHEQIEEMREKQAELAKKADEERRREYFLNFISAVTEPVNKIAESATNVAGSAVGTMAGAHIKNAASSIAQSAATTAVANACDFKQAPNQTSKPIENKGESGQAAKKDEANKNGAADMNNNMSASASLAKQETEIMKIKSELQKQEREANAEIAKVGEILKGLKEQNDDLTASIVSLEMAIKGLGKVKTTFEHTRQFWLGVEKHCKTLTDISQFELMNDPDFKDEFIDALKNSGLSWLSLGKINYTAQLSIQEVDKKTDNIVSNLPTKLEALEIVKREADAIINSLQNETSAVETSS